MSKSGCDECGAILPRGQSVRLCRTCLSSLGFQPKTMDQMEKGGLEEAEDLLIEDKRPEEQGGEEMAAE